MQRLSDIAAKLQEIHDGLVNGLAAGSAPAMCSRLQQQIVDLQTVAKDEAALRERLTSLDSDAAKQV
jgi:hypothetical protein